jgi:uncharacterized protein (TIGR03437 family)
MFHRKTVLWGFVCVAVFTAAASAQSDRIAVLPGAGSADTITPVYTSTPFTLLNNIATPAGAYQVIPKPDGSKYYVISNSPTAAVTEYDQNFNNGTTIATAIQTAPSAAAISPDGKRLLVGANNLFIIDTSTDTIINTGGFPINGGKILDIAFSIDSTSAFVLTGSSTSAEVTQIDLVNNVTGTTFSTNTFGIPTGITVGPDGLLYVSVPYQLFELDPRTMLQTPGTATQANRIGINGAPGKPVFTPDGHYAIMANTQIVGLNSSAVFVVDLTTSPRSVSSYPSGGAIAGLVFDHIAPLGSNRILLFSSQTPSSLFELTLANGVNLTISPIVQVLPSPVIDSFVVSPEVPPALTSIAQNLYLVGTSGSQVTLYKIDLPDNTLLGQTILANGAGQYAQWAGVNPTSGAASMEGFNTSQTLQPGASSLPLVVRVLDAQSRPVFGATVSFTATAGVTLTSTTASTNSDGYAVTYAVTPASGGQLTVTASSGSLTPVAFTLQAIGSGGGGTGTGGAAATVEIVAGNGQIVVTSQRATRQMIIQVNDTSGNPSESVPVTFSITQGVGTIFCGDDFQAGCTAQGGTTISMDTDANGQAGIQFVGSSITPGNSFQQSVITAGPNITGVDNANFVVTTIPSYQANGQPASAPLAELLAPDYSSNPTRTITAGAGQVVTGAIQVQVVATNGAQQGQGIPNVALNVSGTNGTSSPYATCQGGTPLTDLHGIATCDLLMGNILTSTPTPLIVNVGGAINTPTVSIVVNQGPPTKIVVVQGNQQSASPGTLLPVALVGRVTDAGGNPIPNSPVSWKVVQGSATLSNTSSVTDVNGNASAKVTLGATAGTVQVQLTAGSGSGAPTAIFTLTATVPFGGMTAVSGGGQTAIVGTQFSQPLIVLVNDSTGKPLAGVPVTFAVTGGSASVGTPNATTNSQGQASTNVTAGPNPGAITVTATSNSVTVSFSLTSQPVPPSVTPASFQNAASGAVGLVPCGIATVTGNGLVPGVTGLMEANMFTGPLPTALGPVNSLQVAGVNAPIFWVDNANGKQTIAFQTPCETPVGTANVVVTVNGSADTIQGVSVSQYQPGVFTYVDANGKTYGVLLHAFDGSYVTPSNPAHPGESVILFVTGLGQTAPAIATGHVGSIDQMIDTSQLVIGVNNGGVPVTSAQYLPGSIGLYIVTFTVPSGTPSGNINLALAEINGGNLIFGNGSLIPIAQ